MPDAPRIVAFAGSTRTGSFNKKVLGYSVSRLRATGMEVTHVDLRDFPMPLYDGDLEQREGIPERGRAFKRLLIEHQGFLIASPEYNSSISGVLKNAIDWASRSEPNEHALVAFRGKVAGLLSASPGALGGLRALVHVRAILGNIGVLVVPEQVAVTRAHESLDDAGAPKDEGPRKSIENLVQRLATVVRRLSGP